MIRLHLILACAMVLPAAAWGDAPHVQVQPSHLQGPRPLAPQTQTAVIRDYLQSWQSLRAALDGNQTALLDTDFVGAARDKLKDTVEQQTKLGIHTRYQDRAHNIRIVFYSPDGLSIQLLDDVEYDQQLMRQGQVLTDQHVHTRYVVVLAPSEVRWEVRIFQAEPN